MSKRRTGWQARTKSPGPRLRSWPDPTTLHPVSSKLQSSS
jgi:hypothetical protein